MMVLDTRKADWRIDAGAQMGRVALRVADLRRSLRFYTEILGFRDFSETPGTALLGAESGEILLELVEAPVALPVVSTATGLYHAAILTPTRADLGRLLQRLIEREIPFGQSDHLVSEALYLSDPDGHGLELYSDRPRSEWSWSNGSVAMAVDPLDLDGLLAEADSDGAQWTGLPAGTRIGHVHLRVGDLTVASEFYHGILGFDITCSMSGALFVSAGRYHHHLGLNVWQSKGRGPAPTRAAAMDYFTIVLPNADALAGLAQQLEDAGVPSTQLSPSTLRILDPWRNVIILHG
ncbi:MAG: VOC family protein [Capsulimonadaceae bacterium]